MSSLKTSFIVAAVALAAMDAALAAEHWQESVFPPPNAGRLAFVSTSDGNPACASYDGASCLWAKSRAEIDFSKVKPLACGARHRELYGATGFEDPKHWCNLALRAGAPQSPAAPPPGATAAPRPPEVGRRMTEWSGWAPAAGIDYRYRIGWDPATGGPGKTVEAIYEIGNPASKTWPGVARSLDCEIRPNLVRQGKFD
jgi:hypothetical protein